MSKVEKTFSFASWASDHPSDPVPGDRIDVQFANHRKAIESLDEAVRRLVRADGKLNHDLLTPESLPKDLTLGLASETAKRIEQSVDPLVASARQHLFELERAQLDLQATLAEIKHRQREATKLLDSTAALSEIVHTHARQAMQSVTRAANLQAQAFEDANWNELQANTAEDWALVSTTWAEFMDGNATIPPNILASNSITGDHWSSRWWAHRAAGAAGMLAWWYQGAWPSPGPPTTPNTPTGQPLPPGSIYFDTDLGVMMVWNGSTWVNANAPAKGATSSLYYLASAGQTLFLLGTVDLNGHTFAFNQTTPEGLQAYVNGVRLTPTLDFTLDTVGSSVTFLHGLSLNSIVAFDMLTPASMLAPSGSALTVLLNPITPDGVKTVFTGLTVAADSAPVNVAKNEELLVSVNGVQQQPGAAYNAFGAQITFAQAPEADANVFIIWFGPAAATRSATHSPEALAYLARTMGGNEGGNGANIATLIDGLVSDGVWAKLDALYVLAQQNQTDALLNLVGTSYSLAASLFLNKIASFTSYVGYNNFGMLNTSFDPTTAPSPHYTQNDAGFGVWSYAVIQEAYPQIGQYDADTGASIYNKFTDGTFISVVNGGGYSRTPSTITKGLFAAERLDASNVQPYQNGVSAGAITSAYSPVRSAPFAIGYVLGPSTQTLSAAFIGASLGAAGQLALYNRLRTYMTAVGVP